MKDKYINIILFFLILIVPPLSAIERGEDWGITPLPVVAYTPETAFLFGFSGLAWYQPPENTLTNMYMFEMVYTTKKQLALRVGLEHYALEEKLKVETEVSYSLFPDSFWAIGPDAPDCSQEEYTPLKLELRQSLPYRIFPAFHLGPVFRITRHKLDDMEEGGILYKGITGSEGGRNLGLGYCFIYDTRDSNIYPGKGTIVSCSNIYFSEWGGLGEYSYQCWEVDLRKYISLSKKSQLALRGTAFLNSGSHIPFQELPVLGGPFLMRGYYQGRYRDKNTFSLQGEYRFPMIGRLRGVLFGSAGAVASAIEKFSDSPVRLAGGTGLRFAVNKEENLNLRLDSAYSAEGFKIYFGVLEAF